METSLDIRKERDHAKALYRKGNVVDSLKHLQQTIQKAKDAANELAQVELHLLASRIQLEVGLFPSSAESLKIADEILQKRRESGKDAS